MKTYLDHMQGYDLYGFIKTPVWFSVEVDVPKELVDAHTILAQRFGDLNRYLATVYERRRAGVEDPVELPTHIKEIIDSCLVPAEARRGKKPKQQDSAADSSTPSPEA